jgi:membrane protein
MQNRSKEKNKKLREFIRFVYDSYLSHECTKQAAALAFYGLFSIFPLLLFLVNISSLLISSETSRDRIDAYIYHVFPLVSDDLIMLIDQTITARGSIGLISAVGLLWSGSSIFSSLETTLSRIWGTEPRSYLRRRGLAAISVLVLGIAFIASFFLGPLTSWLFDGIFFAYRQFLVSILEIIIVTIAVLLLYRIFPNEYVRWAPAFLGALISAILIVLVKYLFGFYVNLVISNYGLVYGSLAWFLALALWVYIISVLLLMGAEFAAAFQKRYIV